MTQERPQFTLLADDLRELTKRVRIGWARDPERQLRLLRRAPPTGPELLGAWPGSKEDEARIVEKLRSSATMPSGSDHLKS